MPIPFVPFYFRGGPRKKEHRMLLEELLGYSILKLQYAQGLPRSQEPHAVIERTDAEVMRLYSQRAIRMINAHFFRFLPVLPWNTDSTLRMGDRLQIMKNTFRRIEYRPEQGKVLIFLEQPEELYALNAAYPPSPPRDWLRRIESGLMFILPLYDANRSRVSLGAMKEFISRSNQELLSLYVSLAPSRFAEAPPPSSRRRTS